jgi:CTP:molybdopterin cytidylyltransferase MocA
MVCSIHAALPAVRGEAFFIAHADMPFVDPESYRSLAAAREARMIEAAFVASHLGRAGHPVLLPSAWIPGILALPPGDRLRPFLSDKPSVGVETGPGALRDIDTPEEYLAALEAMI